MIRRAKSANKAAAFDATFLVLRAILEAYSSELIVSVDKPGDYQLCSRTMKDRIGRPLFVAAVQIKKNYVAYHLMPACSPKLWKTISPFLRKKMQGKSCFNFTTINDEEIDELGSLTKAGIDGFKNIKLPWSG